MERREFEYSAASPELLLNLGKRFFPEKVSLSNKGAKQFDFLLDTFPSCVPLLTGIVF